ncbi:unnamed protein product, partial [Medioppia subpectinata]
ADSVVVDISDATDGSLEVALHPKNAELGKREVKTGKQVLIDQTDAQQIAVSDTVTFINWGNMSITAVTKDPKTGLVTKIDAKLNLDNKDFKKTLKVTWIETSATIPAILTYFEHIISKPVLKPDDDFKNFINRDTKLEVQGLTDSALKSLKKGDIIQIQRKGFFICDSVYDEKTIRFAGKAAPVVLISIPDGSTDLNIFPKSVQEWKKKTLLLSQNTDNKSAPKGATDLAKILADIKECGDSVRQLKADKASKEQITEKVNKLLALKTEFKTKAGIEWKPDIQLSQITDNKSAPKGATDLANKSGPKGATDLAKILADIKECGDSVRQLKTDKASKEQITEKVNKLLALKTEFKTQAGVDWKPDIQLSQLKQSNPSGGDQSNDIQKLDALVRAQGEVVRKLKTEKAAKDVITESVNKLLSLKADFKKAYGKDWTPDLQLNQTNGTNGGGNSGNAGQELDDLVQKQADSVRQLKSDKADKALVDEAVK